MRILSWTARAGRWPDGEGHEPGTGARGRPGLHEQCRPGTDVPESVRWREGHGDAGIRRAVVGGRPVERDRVPHRAATSECRCRAWRRVVWAELRELSRHGRSW